MAYMKDSAGKRLDSFEVADAAKYRKRVSGRDLSPAGETTQAGAATIGAWTATSAITTPRKWPSVTNSGSVAKVSTANFTYSGAANLVPYGAAYPDYLYVTAKSIKNGTLGMPMVVEFMHYGTGFDLLAKGIPGFYFRISVNGQVVGSVPTSSNGSNTILPVTFATAATRRIRIETSGGPFGGIQTAPTDAVWKANVFGPRIIVAGDSYTQGTGAELAGGAGSWVRTFANALGLTDVWGSGVGGTGYMNPGPDMKMRDRLQQDVINYAPDYVIWAMGHNDTSYTQAQVQAEALACFQAVKTALPKCVQIVTSPLWGPGVSSFTPGLFGARDGIKAAAAQLGLPFVDLMEIPLASAGVSTTTTSAVTSAGYATISTADVVPIGSTIHIGTYPNGERAVVTNVSGVGPFTLTMDVSLHGTSYPVGTAVREVGSSFFTGSGNVGNLKGNGNCDVFLASDAAHPTQAGHQALGIAVATQIAQYGLI